MRSRYLTLTLCIALWSAAAACAPERPPPHPPALRFTPPDANGVGRVGELIYLEEILGDAQPTDTLPMLVLLHGRGDKVRRGWLPITPASPVRVIMPQAPLPFDTGHSWFRVRAIEAKGPRGEELAREIAQRADQITAAVDVLCSERPTRGLPIAAGFSQGGMLSYALAVRHPEAFRALLPIAGLLPEALWPTAPHASTPPVLALHGTADPLVPIEAARETVRHLAQTGYRAELREFEGVPHTLTPEMLAVISSWLDEALR